MWNRRFIILSVLSTLLGIGGAVAEGKLDVLEHFKALSATSIDGFPRYKIENTDSTGHNVAARDYEGFFEWPIPAYLNKRAGYLRIEDEGTGGGSFLAEVVLWRARDGSALIGTAGTGFEFERLNNTAVDFYVADGGGRYLKITRDVWPRIEVANFMTREMTIGDLEVLTDLGATVYVSLPEKGTDATAYLVLSHQGDMFCDDSKYAMRGGVEAHAYFCENLKDHIYTSLHLGWNKDERRFSVGERRLGPMLSMNAYAKAAR